MIVNLFFNERGRARSRGAYHPLRRKRYPFTNNEKIVVKLAASIKGMTMADYISSVVVPKAKQDAKTINEIFDTL
jgi:hypothetical protein